jgi:1-deoxy-D-xylulose-5-phosphate synthase
VPLLLVKVIKAIVGNSLSEFMTRSEDVFAITPATPYASGIEELMKKFPNRAIDVGMAEQHAVGMAAGLAIKGKNSICMFSGYFYAKSY